MRAKEKAMQISSATVAYWMAKYEALNHAPLAWLSGDAERCAQLAYFKALGYKVRVKG